MRLIDFFKNKFRKTTVIAAKCHFCGDPIDIEDGYYKCMLFEGFDHRGNRVEPTNSDCRYLEKKKCLACANKNFGHVCKGCHCSMQKFN